MQLYTISFSVSQRLEQCIQVTLARTTLIYFENSLTEFHSLTCRKRHLKCDEVTPFCGPCMRSKQTCIFAISTAHSAAPATELLALTDNRRSEQPEVSLLRVQSSNPKRLESGMLLRHVDASLLKIYIKNLANFEVVVGQRDVGFTIVKY